MRQFEMHPSSPVPGFSQKDQIPLYQVLSLLPKALLLLDEKLKICFCNKNFCTLFNLDENFKNFEELTFVELLDAAKDQFEDTFKTYTLFKNLIHNRTSAKGQPLNLRGDRYINLDYEVIAAESNLPYHLFLFNDETISSKALISLNAEKKLFENILNHVPSDVVAFTPDSKYIYLNQCAVKDKEMRKWLIGKTDIDYCNLKNKYKAIGKNRSKLLSIASKTQKSFEWEEQLSKIPGEFEYHLRKINPVLNEKGETEMLIGYGLNISERKKIEQRIQFSEKRYRDLFNYSQAGICTHDMEGNFLTANPALCECTGFTMEEMLSKNLANFILPEDRDKLQENYLSIILTNSKTNGVFRITRKDGSIIYLLYKNFKVEEEGIPPYIIGFAHDITERINIERKLKNAQKETENSARLKEEFMANMSHEIRTPMNGVIGMASLLAKTSLTPEQKHFLKIIDESAQNLLLIINDILDIEKIAAGHFLIESIPFELVSKTQSVINLFIHIANQKGIRLSFNNKLGDKLTVYGDPTRFIQILNNLVSNAIKFTYSGSITISAEIIKTKKETVTIQYCITDTGIGIEENKIVAIFEPYTQAYSDTTRKFGGTGLGLAITKNLLELQGGKISVESIPGAGSKFRFTLDYKKSEEEEMYNYDNGSEKNVLEELGNLKVLLAEDNEVNQILAQSILKYWGLKAQTAKTGNEVLDLLQKEDFDLVLMDIQMPEKSGIEATREIRNLDDENKKNIPIIALTANALKGEERKYIEAGMDDFLTKPFKENELYEVISRVFKNKGSFGRPLKHDINKFKISTVKTEVEKDILYDLVLINELSRGNDDFVLSLINIFINTVPENAHQMLLAAEAKNWDKVSKQAHKLKSTIDTLNIKTIKQDIRSIEINAKHKVDLSTVVKQINKVHQVILQTSQQLQEQFNVTPVQVA